MDSQPGCAKQPDVPDLGSETEDLVQEPRLSQISSQNIAVSEIKSGRIQKVVVRNFMCHSYLEVDLNSHMNFIIGRNGSGKSAILAAIVIGLGGNAGTTNRGSSLKEFIKKGFSSSIIEITLSNTGYNCFEPEVYGESIIVERKLNASGGSSGYKIKAANGVLQSKKRSELDRIINSFNIQVDNPISVLNQDTARSFLNSSNPHDKYELFMKATQLHLLWEILLNTVEVKCKAIMSLNEKKTSLLTTKNELEELELRWNRVKAVRGYRKKIVDLRDEMNWAVADYEENRLALVTGRRVEEEAKIPPLQVAIESHDQQVVEKQVQFMAIESQINAIRADVNKNEVELQEAKAMARRRNEAYGMRLRSFKSLKLKLNRLQVNVDSLVMEIDNLKKVSDPSNEERQKQIKENISRLSKRYLEVKDTIQPLNLHFSQLQEQYTKQKELLQQKKMQPLELGRRADKLKAQIASLKINSSDKLSVYGSMMPVLVKKIEEAGRKGMFLKQPIGPIGAYLEIRDASWTPAIENFLGPILRSFCVDNTKDSKTLSQLIKGTYSGQQQKQPAIIISKFFNVVHDVRMYAVQTPPGMLSVLDALIINHPVIANCLIDQRELESILLIPTLEEACNLMSEVSNVPLNCKRAITKEGDLFYPDPNYRCYANNISSNAQYLHVSMPEIIKNKEKELDVCEKCKTALDVELEHLTTSLKENFLEIVRLQKEKSSLNQNILSIKAELEELKNAEEPEPTSTATLLAEMDETCAQRSVFKQESLQLEQECNTLKEELEEAKRTVTALREVGRKLQGAEIPLVAELEMIRDGINEHSREKSYKACQVEELEGIVKRIIVREDEQRIAMEKAFDLAQKVHPERIISTKSPVELDDEIRALELAVLSVEKDHGNFRDVAKELGEKKERYNQISATIKSVDKALASMDILLKNRDSMYTQIRKLVSVRVSQLFSMMLYERKYSGEINIDHENRILEIIAQPSSRDPSASGNTRTLSGGERSYTTVVFIIALWDVANTPFFFLDEFDVFMDKVNRRVVLEMLTTQAASKSTSQFVFLTPQDLSSVVATSNITIHRMDNPREDKRVTN